MNIPCLLVFPFKISSRITELLESQEEAVAEAWGGEGEPSRILHDLEMVYELDKTCVFIHPVDLEQIPPVWPSPLTCPPERMSTGEEGQMGTVGFLCVEISHLPQVGNCFFHCVYGKTSHINCPSVQSGGWLQF